MVAAPPSRLLTDFERLADYYRQRGLVGEDLNPAELAFSVALVRYHLAPPAGPVIAEKTQVMVYGGAGAGKSTVANILLGVNVADVNAQAGYTRRPTAYAAVNGVPQEWPDRLGPLVRSAPNETADADADRYAVRPLNVDTTGDGFLSGHVVWDCPDLTTKDASYYEFRAIEIAALADVGVYVASDERYNDQLPTHFLQAMLDAGKPSIVVLTKASPHDAEELVHLFETQVAATMRNRDLLLAVIAIPAPGRNRMDKLWTPEFPYGGQLRSIVVRAVEDRARNRRTAGRAVAKYLRERQGRLLDPLRKDLGEWQAWAEQVRQAANDAVLRYEREHLARVDYPEFRDATEKLLAAFTPAGPLEYGWKILEVLRWPGRWLTGHTKALPNAGRSLTADAALDRIRRGMMEQLQVAAAARRGRHRFWSELHSSLDREARTLVEPAYKQLRDRQRRIFEERLRDVAGVATTLCARRPGLAFLLQIGRFVLDVGLLAWLLVALLKFGVSWVVILVALPLAAGILDAIARWGCMQYIDRYRSGLVRRQREDVREAVQVAYIDTLVRLPRSAGGSLKDLAALAVRIPADAAAAERGTDA